MTLNDVMTADPRYLWCSLQSENGSAQDASIPGLSQKDCLRGSGSVAGSVCQWWGKYQSGYQWRRRWLTESETGDQRCSQPKPRITHSFLVITANINDIALKLHPLGYILPQKVSVYLQTLSRNAPRKLPNSVKKRNV